MSLTLDLALRKLVVELGYALPDGPDTPVFIFSSTELKHIWIALQRRMWAIADIMPDQLASRVTKARELPLGADGLFYCSDAKCFTVPFRIQSQPELREVRDVWPSVWHFPFKIEPRGDLGSRIPLAKAKTTWKALEGASNPTTRINMSGGMAFVPSWLYRSDWELVLRTLETKAKNAQL